MSQINTGTINVNYPVPGTNNSSQGFRDNFTAIKNNLDVADTEITELQNKAVLKSALEGLALNNDMNNTLISNALIQRFRQTTFPLGNNLSGIVTVDLTKGDFHYGTVTDDCSIQFTKWAPSGTYSAVELMLTIGSPALKVTFPPSVVIGVSTIENMVANTVTIPGTSGVDAPSVLHFKFTTIDCGTTVEIIPVNRPRIATQLVRKTPTSSKGQQGDRAGDIVTDNSYIYVCIQDWDGGTLDIWRRTAITGGAW